MTLSEFQYRFYPEFPLNSLDGLLSEKDVGDILEAKKELEVLMRKQKKGTIRRMLIKGKVIEEVC